VNDTLRRGIDLSSLCLLVGIVGFGALVVDAYTVAWGAGLAAGLLAAAAGLTVQRGIDDLPEGERINYPYHTAQRGRRVVYMGLTLAVGALGFGGLQSVLVTSYGRLFVILAGALAISGPILLLPGLFWLADGIALRTGLDARTRPLLGAAASMALAGLIALVAALTTFEVSLTVLSVLGGIVPCVLVLWTYRSLAGGLTGRQVDKQAPA
jgi:hypothetical protein